MARVFRSFEFKAANYRAAVPDFEIVKRSIRTLRSSLEAYIRKYPGFARSLVPLEILSPDAPECARRMHTASLLTGVGPMAAVAGTFSQMVAEMCQQKTGLSADPPTASSPTAFPPPDSRPFRCGQLRDNSPLRWAFSGSSAEAAVH